VVSLQIPHGGKIVVRVLKNAERTRLLRDAHTMPKLILTDERSVDVENICKGIYSPLEGFIGSEDFQNILDDRRLSNDLPWTIPIVLDVSDSEIKNLREGDDVILQSHTNGEIAVMHIDEIYTFNKKELAEKVFQTTESAHPGVAKTYRMKEKLVAGKIDLINELTSPYAKFKLNPTETRILFKEKGWDHIIGFQTRNPPHLGHEWLQKTALTFVDGIFINPIIGRKKKGDFRDDVILRSYEVLISHYYLKERAVLAILNTEMKYAGPREAIHHAIMRKNFGCTHFIVGRDHAGVGNYYEPYAAQRIFEEFPDLGIVPVFFKSFFYCKKCMSIASEKICPHDEEYHISFSGTKIRNLFSEGKRPSEIIMRPEVSDVILNVENPFVNECEK
jgi:sulfate adenylyltransferase